MIRESFKLVLSVEMKFIRNLVMNKQEINWKIGAKRLLLLLGVRKCIKSQWLLLLFFSLTWKEIRKFLPNNLRQIAVQTISGSFKDVISLSFLGLPKRHLKKRSELNSVSHSSVTQTSNKSELNQASFPFISIPCGKAEIRMCLWDNARFHQKSSREIKTEAFFSFKVCMQIEGIKRSRCRQMTLH